LTVFLTLFVAPQLAERLGFTEIERFEAYGAEQWFGRWTLL